MSSSSCTLYDLLGLKGFDQLKAEETRSEQPTTPDGYSELAAKVVSKYSNSAPVDVIVPGHLLLGSRDRARDREFLASLGVTDVLVMAVENSDNGEEFEGSNIRFWKVVLPDILGFPVIGILRSALHTMLSEVFVDDLPPLTLQDLGENGPRNTTRNNRHLFVHCTLGISRSASFTIFYILYRLFIDWPEGRTDGPRVQDILTKIQDLRPICPNVCFFAQLRTLEECLSALLPFTASHFERETLRQSRVLQFNTALLWCETYFDTETRVMAECMAYIQQEPLSELRRQAMAAVGLGLSAWSLKSSPLKRLNNWLPSALILENFNIYTRQIPSGMALLSMGRGIEREKTSFEKNLIGVKKRMGLLAADEQERLSFPCLSIYTGAAGPAVDWVHGDEGGLLKDVPAKVDIVNEAVRPIRTSEEFRLPKGIIWTLDHKRRLESLQYALGVKSTGDHTTQWDAVSLMDDLTKACRSTMEALGLLTTKFDCTTWSVWLAHRASQQCRRLWNSLMQWGRSHEKAKGELPPRVSSEEARQPPDPRGVSSGDDTSGGRKRRHPNETVRAKKKLRYELTDMKTLEREVARMRRTVRRLKGRPVVSTQI